MDHRDDPGTLLGWELLSDALGALSLGVLLLGALALPHLL